jgi:glycolate oxidase
VSLEAVLPDGTLLQIGDKELDLPGYDLLGLLTGSEGTMALVTKIGVRLMRQPEAVKTMLAIFNTPEEAGNTVAELTARQILPVALEMFDGPMIRMVEEATHAGYPPDAGAVLLIEMEGLREAVEWQAEMVAEICRETGATEVRTAKSPEERDLLWKGRKNAFGAVGRISPYYYVQDGVVPRSKIAQTLHAIAAISKKYDLKISNIFHAGDGNLHPIILFDARKEGELRRAQLCGEEILEYCISIGGSITGVGGVGMEKMELMAHLFSDDSLEMIRRFKALFDPQCRLNPGKVLPTGKGCMEIRQPAAMVV